MRRAALLLGAVVVCVLAPTAIASSHGTAHVTFHPNRFGVTIVMAHTKPRTACESSPTFGRVSIGNRRNLLILLTEDICESESWRRIICHGADCRRAACQREGCGNLSGIPGFGVFTLVNSRHGLSRINVETNGDNATQEYRVVARSGTRREVGRLTINRERSWSRQRVYEGSDAFVNYCIDRDREIRSFHGALFCWRVTPERGPNTISFHRGE